MARESGVALEKVTMNLFAGDKDTLTSFHPAKGWSVAAREVLHIYCERLRERDSQEVLANTMDLDVELPSLKDLKEV